MERPVTLDTTGVIELLTEEVYFPTTSIDLPRELTLVTTSDLSKSSSSRGMQGVVVVGLILELMGRLVEEEGVGFVGCQKCIHPLVKEYLLERVRLWGFGTSASVAAKFLVPRYSLVPRPPQT